MIELLGLGTNLYLVSRDKDLVAQLSKFAKSTKDTLHEMAEKAKQDDEEGLMYQLLLKIKEAEQDIEKKIGEMAEKVYEKLQLAHISEVRKLRGELEELRGKIEALRREAKS